MSPHEIYLTAAEARARFHLSESGWRSAWQNGNVPAPIKIGGKLLWARSRLDAFEQRLLDDATKREAEMKAKNPLNNVVLLTPQATRLRGRTGR